jgi:hypothetical protein
MSSEPEAIGRTIQLFLVDGTPNGLMIASIHGWTGSVLVANQANFPRLLARAELDRTGVYFLFGPDPIDALSMRAYIGEADSVRERISQSAAERAFWETAVAVTTSDEALTKGHVRYLEARLIDIAGKAGRVHLDNGQTPKVERRSLPEADRSNMEAFLANMRVILPVIGFDILKDRPAAAMTKASSAPLTGQIRFEIQHKSGVRATGTEENGEFVVLQGSQALKDAGYQGANSYGDLKRELMAQRVLVEASDGNRFVFSRAYAFKSPSAAAAVVLDRNSNGRTEWKVAGSKQTYHEWQEQAVIGGV